MNLKRVMIERSGLAPAVAELAFERVGFSWEGVRVYMKESACSGLSGSRNGPSRGGAAHLAADIEAAILAEGGTAEHVQAVFLDLRGACVWVGR